MQRATKKVEKKRLVRYKEGAEMYSMGMTKFQTLAKDAGAILKIDRMVLVDLDIFDQYLGQVTYEYLDGYNGLVTPEAPPEVVVSEDLEQRLKNSELSESAKQYLTDGVYHVAFGM